MTVPSTTAADPRLLANLDALARTDPRLAQRITWPVAGDRVQVEQDGRVWFRLHHTLHRLDVTPEQVSDVCDSLRERIDGEGELFVFGLGLGEVVAELLDTHAQLSIVAWERDPWLVRLALSRSDFSAALASGRLRLLLGVDLLERVAPASATPSARWDHPLLGALYGHERRLLEGPPRSRHALLGLGGLFVQDVADALDELGYGVLPVDFEGLSREELDHTVERLAPELVVRINHLHGLPEFCAAHGLTLLLWEVDPATDRIRAPQAPTTDCFLFTYREKHVADYREAGFEEVRHLPLASNTELRRPLESPASAQVPVAFVGSSMVAQASALRATFLRQVAACGGPQAVAPGNERLRQILDEQRADYSRYCVPELLAQSFPELLSWARESDTRERPEMLVGEIAAAEKRLHYVARLGRQGLHVWGDEGWRAVERHGARWRGSAGHRHELTAIYNSVRIHVDIGRLYQMDIVTMRVFDVLACGGFLLAERSDGLEELFRVGEELEAYGTLAELEDKVRYFARHPEAARRIARQGCEAVTRRHTIPQRVRHMLEVARSRRESPVG